MRLRVKARKRNDLGDRPREVRVQVGFASGRLQRSGFFSIQNIRGEIYTSECMGSQLTLSDSRYLVYKLASLGSLSGQPSGSRAHREAGDTQQQTALRCAHACKDSFRGECQMRRAVQCRPLPRHQYLKGIMATPDPIRERPHMTSALEGGGGHGKADLVWEVA